jgi:catecholate siderophore receptor
LTHQKPAKPAKTIAESGAASEKTLMPLGALMLAMSVSSWAQSTLPATEAAKVEGKTLAPVVVTGARECDQQTYQSGITSSGKVPVLAKDIPQSLTVVNEKLLHNQGKDNFKSALENVIGITFEAGEGGRVGDNIRLRGFSAAGDIYQDGMRDIAQYNRDTSMSSASKSCAARHRCCLAGAPPAASSTKSANNRA